MNDARHYFDQYIIDNCTWHEIVEVLRYTYLFGERCIGRVYRKRKPTLQMAR